MGLLPGDVIDGRFKIGHLIGYGGQGVVLSVQHLGWARNLALKLPLPEAVNSPKKRERFLREAETWIRLGVHPHIVRCWFVRKVSGLPGLFLDLITGGSLEDKLNGGQLGPDLWVENLEALLQVAEGLAHSHKMGVIHRDIKPENLLITKEGEVRVTDFGLVKSTSRNILESQSSGVFEPLTESTKPGVTGAGEFLGTPRYGAPEQWNKSMQITTATDIYALGVIFFEMLCGRRPFDGPGEENMDPLQLIHRHLKDPVPDPRTFHPSVPEPLALLCLRCLSKDPSERPQDAIEMVDLLSEVHESVNGKRHLSPADVPGGDRADLMNNAGVSLYSLGMVDECRENLERGLLLQADHPQCLYNLIQLDRREGKMGSVESLQRLRRANAEYPLALLCIEEGHAHLATEILKSIPLYKKDGLVYRTEGDALMYQGEFDRALEFYRKARTSLPNDSETAVRIQLATEKSRSLDGTFYFPSPVSSYRNKIPSKKVRLLLSNDGKSLFSVTDTEVVNIDISGSGLVKLEARPEDASPVFAAWLGEDRLVLQDRTGFELWDPVELKLLQRQAAKMLTATESLSHMVFFKGQNIYVLDRLQRTNSPLKFPPNSGALYKAKASFTCDQSGLYFITVNGRIGQVDPQFRVVPLDWPTKLEEIESLRLFHIHQSGLLVTTTSDAMVCAYDLTQEKILFRQKLPFSPTSLHINASGQSIVVSSPRLFGVLNLKGEVVHRGKGACAVDARLEFVLGWAGGCLTLYALNPFRKIRAWTEKIDPPYTVTFSQDGRRAVTLAASGEYHIWEVDENHRVYERELLLTPGESYQQLIESYEAYKRAYTDAVNQHKAGDSFMAYTSLKLARSAPGFVQDEDALQFQWQLARSLERGGIDALWERAFLNNVTASSLSRDGKNIGIARDNLCISYGFDGSSLNVKFHVKSRERILGCHYYARSNKEDAFYIVDQQGRISVFDARVGIAVTNLETGLKPLVKVRFYRDSLFMMTDRGVGAVFELSTLTNKGQTRLGTTHPNSVFPFLNSKALSVLDAETVIVDLVKDTTRPGFPVILDRFPGRVSCLVGSTECGLVMAGFVDGSVAIADLSSGKAYFEAQYDTGAVTGLNFNKAAAMGVSVSAKGRLTIFDLNSKEILRSFTAHPHPIEDLAITDSGRYFTTRTVNGEFRLWEIAWALSHRPGPIKVSWMPKNPLGTLGKLFGRG